jgi:hypothetical protein
LSYKNGIQKGIDGRDAHPQYAWDRQAKHQAAKLVFSDLGAEVWFWSGHDGREYR